MTLATIEDDIDVANGLAKLLRIDPRLVAVAAAAGPLPLRRREGGFEGLAHVVMGQQISTSAAGAIWSRLEAAVQPFTSSRFLVTPETTLRAAGLSAAKVRTLTAIAGDVEAGLDLLALHDISADEAVRALVALKGVGPWTAESYLLFCVGHPDVFPAGDLALQAAAHRGLDLDARPDETAMRAIAARWSPWRGIAARLFWAYYRVSRDAERDAGRAARTKGSKP